MNSLRIPAHDGFVRCMCGGVASFRDCDGRPPCPFVGWHRHTFGCKTCEIDKVVTLDVRHPEVKEL